MPFAQFFSGGQAFHGRYASIYHEPGSHGCVNLAYRDAEELWRTLRKGDAVLVFGRKPQAASRKHRRRRAACWCDHPTCPMATASMWRDLRNSSNMQQKE